MSNSDLIAIVRTKKVQGQPDESILQELSATYPASEVAAALTALQYMRPDAIQPSQTSAPVSQAHKGTSPRTSNLFAGFGFQIINFLIGLVIIAIVGIVLGFTMNGGLVSQAGQDFGAVGDMLSFYYLIPVVTFVFAIAAFVTKDYLLVIYPVAAFYVAPLFKETMLVKLIAGYTRFEPPKNNTDFNDYVATVAISYIAVYCVFKIIRYIWLILMPPTDVVSVYTPQAVAALSAIILVSAGGVAAASKPLYIHQQRGRVAVRIPTTDTIKGSYEDSDYRIRYVKPTKQSNGTYQRIDTVSTTPLKNWWETDVHDNCGDKISSRSDGPLSPQNYHKTPKGRDYAEAIFDDITQQPPTPTTKFKEHKYCFVEGAQRYALTRSELGGDAYLKEYPTGQVIDAIIAGKTYLTKCSPNLKYCNSNDAKDIAALNANAKTSVIRYPDNMSNPINPNAYPEVGRLAIAEWGISIALSDDIKDAYYVPGNAKGIPDVYTIGLQKYASDQCSVKKIGSKIIGPGVATIKRTKVTPQTSKDLPQIDGYTYLLGASYGDLVVCGYSINRAITADENSQLRRSLEDIFIWSNANVK